MRSFRVILGLLLLAGCAGQGFIYNNAISSSYRPTEFGYGAGRRDLTTVIVGNPFDLDQDTLDTKLVAKLNASRNLLQPTHFTTTPGPSARPRYRAVFYFDAQPVILDRLCRDPAKVPKADLGATLRLTAVFCRDQAFFSTVTGELDGLTDIDDPRFDNLIRQMVILLFPPIDPTEDGNGGMRLLIVQGMLDVLG